MTDQLSNAQRPEARESEIELLARETNMPIDAVEKLYRVERDKLESSARIKTFVPVLTHRKVKALLQVQSGRRH